MMSKEPKRPEREEVDLNRDPLSGEKGAHPVGVGLGAAGAGAAGAALGAAAGPVGAAVGAVVGAVAGGLAGKGVAESIDPTVEEEYWRNNYASRPYVDRETSYEHIAPAYRYGWECRAQHSGRTFDEVERDLERGWNETKTDARIGWDRAKLAARDAWERIDSRSSKPGNPVI